MSAQARNYQYEAPCGALSGQYFPVFNPNTGKYGPGKTPYLDTFHAVVITMFPVITETCRKE